MTESRKQELQHLLHEVIENLEIRYYSGKDDFPPPSVNEYRTLLKQRWTVLTIDPIIWKCGPYIVNKKIKSKLLDFIREEFSKFIYENNIGTTKTFIEGGNPTSGFQIPIDRLIQQLMKITIARGVENAVLAVERSTKNKNGPFQKVVLLDGISLKKEIEVFPGIRLVSLPSSTEDFPHYLSDYVYTTGDIKKFFHKTQLIIDCSVSPIFFNQLPERTIKFQVKVNNKDSRILNIDEFPNQFCQALSLACNFSVQISDEFKFVAIDELFNFSALGGSPISSRETNGWPNPAIESDIVEAKRLYELLVNLTPNVQERLQIPISRWIKSHTRQLQVDKMIDLGIAFESLYLSGIQTTTELSFRLRLHASWHIGKNKEDRKSLLKEFKEIYKLRSQAVHGGKLKDDITINGESIPASKFIERSQDLCRKSIIMIMEEGQFPDWNDLILG